MAFRPAYGMQYQQSYPSQQIMFGQMRMPNANPPKPPPATPVFIGNISEKCTDEFMLKMLEECGKVESWKRISGNSKKPQAFGFCNFSELEGTLRALRILNDFHLGEKKLTVKADEKVKIELRKIAIENRKKQGKKDLRLKDGELPADEEDLRKDEEIRLKILNWIENDHPELLTIAEDGELSDKEIKKDAKQEVKKDVESLKKDEKNRKRRSRSRSKGRSRRSRSKESPRNKRSRRSRSSSSSSRSRSSDSSRSRSSDSSRSRSKSRSRSPIRQKSSKRRRERSPTRTSEDSDDAREKRYNRQQIREKEQAYLSRLKRWETREKSRAKLYEREERREKDKKKEIQKEAKRLKHFLEDYDDEKDDSKYYKSSSLFQRKREFEKEREADQKDRLREQQEIDELKKQILEETNSENIDVEEEARKRHKQKEDEALRKSRADSGSPNPHQPLGQSTIGGGEEEEESSSSEGSGSDDEQENGEKKEEKTEETSEKTIENEVAPNNKMNGGGWKAIGGDSSSNGGVGVDHIDISIPTKKSDHIDSPMMAGSSSGRQTQQSQQPIAARLNGVFGTDDDEDDLTKSKKLKPFEITREERMQVMSAEEKKELTRGIIKKIPTSKEDLFATKIEWDFIDGQVMEQRIKPWITKKVKEFIGDEETYLIEFLMEKLQAKTSPEQIIIDIRVIIDDDADMFVVKMWRLLVFEGQARKLGVN